MLVKNLNGRDRHAHHGDLTSFRIEDRASFMWRNKSEMQVDKFENMASWLHCQHILRASTLLIDSDVSSCVLWARQYSGELMGCVSCKNWDSAECRTKIVCQ